ncbi:MAG: DUF4928 family protein [Acidobacteriia bacterium]|nr:DUF4928 family protein [Terriglobia bacterium]
MTKEEQAVRAAVSTWFNSLSKHRAGLPAKGSVAGALVVLERLQKAFDLSIDAHTARGGSQISGAGGAALRKILARFGEVRPFASEGGRTNRGLRGDIRSLLDSLGEFPLDQVQGEERVRLLRTAQQYLVEKVGEYHSRERLKPVFDQSKTSVDFIKSLLSLAKEQGKSESVPLLVGG